MRIDHDDSIKTLTPFTSENLLFPATFSHLGICRRIKVDQSIETFFRHQFALGKGRHNESKLLAEVVSPMCQKQRKHWKLRGLIDLREVLP